MVWVNLTDGEKRMSTKATILLTNDNEHWYRETNARYYESTKSEEAMILEIDGQHRVEQSMDGLRVIIEEGTNLYAELSKLK